MSPQLPPVIRTASGIYLCPTPSAGALPPVEAGSGGRLLNAPHPPNRPRISF